VTYTSQEQSIESGRPVDLYEFEIGGTLYLYTSAEDDQTVLGKDYTALPMKRTRIVHSQESRQSVLEIEMPATASFARLFVTSVPSQKAALIIRQFHRGDGDVATLFVGSVKSVAFTERGTKASVAVDPPIQVSSTIIPRFTFRFQCNNVLGDGANGGPGLCTVDLENAAFKFTGTVSAQSGLDITIPGATGFADGWFEAGTMSTTDGLDARQIIRHVGDVLTLHVPFPFPMVGTEVVLRAGCHHDLVDCGTAKFDIGGSHNIGEFQGFAFVPSINPFEAGIQTGSCTGERTSLL